MKKTITTAIFTVAAALAFADEPSLALPLSANDFPVEKKLVVAEKTSSNQSFTYLRMGVIDSYPTTSVQIVPGVGLGYRLNTGDSAIDFSANYTRGKGYNGKETVYFYTLPKATYLRYATPAKNQSFYGGAGLAFGGLRTKEGTKFLGLIPNATVGYEMNRKGNWHSFTEIVVSQPAVAADLSGKFPGPIAEFLFGVGF